MKKLICLTAVALALTLAAPVQAQTTTMPMAHHEHHPEINKAIRALEKTKYDLEHAAHDYGGHRAKAVELVNGALNELHAALEFDEHQEHH